MRNTGVMTVRRSARSAWLARPEADRDAWNAFRTAAGSVIGQVDADLEETFWISTVVVCCIFFCLCCVVFL